MNAPERAPPAADNALSAAPRTCEECGSPYAPKRGWGRFCTTKCRNDFHGRERRKEALVEAAPKMYAALRMIADGFAQGGDAALVAQAAIKDLKAP